MLRVSQLVARILNMLKQLHQLAPYQRATEQTKKKKVVFLNKKKLNWPAELELFLFNSPFLHCFSHLSRELMHSLT